MSSSWTPERWFLSWIDPSDSTTTALDSSRGGRARSCTEAILTEATHLLGRVKGGKQACLDFFIAGGALLVPSADASLRRCRKLLEEYADLPMDYADSTLVALGEELGTNLVFTTDRRDFAVYRLRGRRHFQVLPG